MNLETAMSGDTSGKQAAARAKTHAPKIDAAASGKAIVPSKAAAPAPGGINLPGGNVVTAEINPRTKAPGVALTIRAPNGAKVIAGSDWPEFNQVLLETVLATIPTNNPDAVPNRVAAAITALAAFKPVDEIEGMLAGQAVAMHLAAMECFRRALLPDQAADVTSKLRKDGANLSRGVTDMLEAFDRKRGKGAQVVRVERVVVHEGGQAIVGNVQPAAKLGEG
jgi:hypothetical protein